MRSLHMASLLAAAVLTVPSCTGSSTGGPVGVAKPGFSVPAAGFDEYGYNEIAGIFNGPADGVDHILDGKVWGSPTYANDHLVMKWNKAWPNEEGAWEMNEWNGQVPGGSGEVWHYKIARTSSPCVNGAMLPDGGYCIWNQYEVVMSQGSFANQHFWDAHANPTGYGVSR